MKRSRAATTLVLIGLVTACSSSGSKEDTTPATLADFCEKCAGCVFQAGFAEGFCTPWIMGTSFDRLACSTKGDTTQLDNQSLTVSQLDELSCDAFDHAE
ncbi:MAG TPA: hypothetical protein VNG33_10510 [Polyangiaceae bacterium]|nr:hypothetical protein [Polyangiaceae bacterium]